MIAPSTVSVASNRDDASKAESFPLNAASNGEAKGPGRRLSFNQSVSQMSSSGSRTRVNLSQRPQRQSSVLYKTSQQFLELPQIPEVDFVDRFQSQRASFDLASLREIIFIINCVGLTVAVADFAIQAVAHSHKSLRYEWGIGFWGGTGCFVHSVVGGLTLARRLRLLLRCRIAKLYFGISACLGGIGVAELTCSVLVYNQAADFITAPDYQPDRDQSAKTMEISVFNSLLAASGLVGILMAIFAVVVTLQRLNIELKIAQSFNNLTNLVSRRPSAIPSTTERPERDGVAIKPADADNAAVT
ncbi:uncharacterized protein LOC129581445 [Paramacrobiotus metropolitanus]|uniref:uncharacterized protein LOC129581445 n=1 Tax=Paramacrobiotus metropolitanus TaxID=2943436 RepID=UPI002445B4AD|nr:uncharacterized protein LOC129581445 [Paramacrobiotus metropolitanus]